MNTKLLRRAQAAILAEPKQFLMEDYFTCKPSDVHPRLRRIPNCGTAGCIAGHVLALMEGWDLNTAELRASAAETLQRATHALDLTTLQAYQLFFTTYWPERFLKHYLQAGSMRAKAQAASDYIDYFIKTTAKKVAA